MTLLSDLQIADVAFQAGFRSAGLQMAIAVCLAESSGDTEAHNVNTNGSTDDGLWQINSIHGYRRDQLIDPAFNAGVAYRLSQGGNDWHPWSVYTNGRYKQFMQRAADAAAGKPVTPGGPPGGAGGPSRISIDINPPKPKELDFGYQPARTLDDIYIDGLAADAAAMLREALFEADIQLSIEEAGELTFRFLDPVSALIANNYIDIGTRVLVSDLDMQIKEFRSFPNNGLRGVQATAAERAIESMKQLTLDNPPANASPTELLAAQARRIGARFYGQGSAAGIEVNEIDRPNGTKSKETMWEYGKRRADELGYKLYAAGGVVWFAKPSWIAAKTTRVRVGVNGAWGDERLDAQTEPTCTSTATPDGTVTTSVSVELPRWRGEQVRPGMGLELKGVDPPHLTVRPDIPLDPTKGAKRFDSGLPALDAALESVFGAFERINQPDGADSVASALSAMIQRQFPKSRGFDKLYIVQTVSWSVAGGGEPVTIEATEPTDPAPKGLGGLIDRISGSALTATFPGAEAPGAMRISDFGAFEYVAAVGRYVKVTFNVSEIGGYRVDSYHEHDTRRCLDIMVYDDRSKGDRINAFLLSLPQTKYTIWQQAIWYPGQPPRAMASRGSPTDDHRDHIHWLSN